MNRCEAQLRTVLGTVKDILIRANVHYESLCKCATRDFAQMRKCTAERKCATFDCAQFVHILTCTGSFCNPLWGTALNHPQRSSSLKGPPGSSDRRSLNSPGSHSGQTSWRKSVDMVVLRACLSTCQKNGWGREAGRETENGGKKSDGLFAKWTQCKMTSGKNDLQNQKDNNNQWPLHLCSLKERHYKRTTRNYMNCLPLLWIKTIIKRPNLFFDDS